MDKVYRQIRYDEAKSVRDCVIKQREAIHGDVARDNELKEQQRLAEKRMSENEPGAVDDSKRDKATRLENRTVTEGFLGK